MKILIVEDDRAVQGALVGILENLGNEVIVAEDGLQGIEKFNDNIRTVDLVMTDYNMPKVNGAVLIAHIRSQRPGIPIILCSGYTKEFVDNRQFKIGTDVTLTKPITLIELRNALDFVAEKRQTKQEIEIELSQPFSYKRIPLIVGNVVKKIANT